MKGILFLAVLFVFFSKDAWAQACNCTDPLARNFDSSTITPGRCKYKHSSIKPLISIVLPSQVSETSGLLLWRNCLWTQNDHSSREILAIDTLSGEIINTYNLPKITKTDWEEIAQDSNFIYIGDFGNNLSGNRRDLKIYRVEKKSLLLNDPDIDSIMFHYPDQTDFTPLKANKTDFDCEAFVVTSDSLYLFTKQWKHHQSRIYSLSKLPGNQVAIWKSTLKVHGLVTGSTSILDKHLIVLCGYSRFLRPFVFLLYDYKGDNFSCGNQRKIFLRLPRHQIEGIATINGLKFYLTNEKTYIPPFVKTQQQMHVIDLSSFLKNYLGEHP